MAIQDVFQLIVSSFENLSDKSSKSYGKRAMILETVAKVRSCVVMLDLECDGLIVEMFQHFLKDIRYELIIKLFNMSCLFHVWKSGCSAIFPTIISIYLVDQVLCSSLIQCIILVQNFFYENIILIPNQEGKHYTNSLTNFSY